MFVYLKLNQWSNCRRLNRSALVHETCCTDFLTSELNNVPSWTIGQTPPAFGEVL
jgi:hypothetical protein